MSYAVQDYEGHLGEDPSLLVATSNLLERFGDHIDPPALDKYLDDFQGYDGDCMLWATEYDGDIKLTAKGVGDLPPVGAAAIVLFHVDGAERYALSEGIDNNRLMIRDADGIVKWADDYEPLYGRPVAWWAYGRPTSSLDPDPVPVLALPVPYVDNIVAGIAYERLPKAPQRMFVSRPAGIDLMDFSGKIDTFRDFSGVPDTHLPYGAEVQVMGTAIVPVKSLHEDFYVPQGPVNAWGNFTRTGQPYTLAGYRQSDLSLERPPKLPPKPKRVQYAIEQPKTAPEPSPAAVPLSWTDNYQPFLEAVRFDVMREMSISDLSGQEAPVTIGPNRSINTLKLYGQTWLNGIHYGRAKPPGDRDFTTCYLVPFFDAETNLPNLVEAVPDLPAETSTRRVTARDRLQLAASTIQKWTDILFNIIKRKK